MADPQPRLTAGTVERPVRGDTHAGCGERSGETGLWQQRHRAPDRLNRCCSLRSMLGGPCPTNPHVLTLGLGLTQHSDFDDERPYYSARPGRA